MEFNYKSPELSDAEIAEINAPREQGPRSVVAPGRYKMKVQNIRARALGTDGKFKGEIFFVHTERKDSAGATLSLFRSKNDATKDSTVTSKMLMALGSKLGVGSEGLRTISWAEATDVNADQYGSLPAAVLITTGNGPEILALEGLEVDAYVDVETFPKKDGSIGKKNVVKAIL